MYFWLFYHLCPVIYARSYYFKNYEIRTLTLSLSLYIYIYIYICSSNKPTRVRSNFIEYPVQMAVPYPSKKPTKCSLRKAKAGNIHVSKNEIDNSLKVDQAVRVFVNVPGEQASVPGRVIPRTPKIVLDASLLITQHYKLIIKGKCSNPKKGVASFPTRRWSCYCKKILRVHNDYGH